MHTSPSKGESYNILMQILSNCFSQNLYQFTHHPANRWYQMKVLISLELSQHLVVFLILIFTFIETYITTNLSIYMYSYKHTGILVG